MTPELESIAGVLADVSVKSSVAIVLALLFTWIRNPSAVARRGIWAGVLCAVAAIALASALNVAPWRISTPQPAEPAAAAGMTGAPPGIDVGLLLLSVWGTGAAIHLALVAGAHLRLRRLLGDCREVSLPDGLRDNLTAQLGLRRRVRVVEGSASVGPFTCGVIAPTVVLPASWRTWSSRQLRAVLLHELAHVRADDALLQNAGLLFCGLQWFNPLAWMAVSQLRAACEAAADVSVLRSGVTGPDYAESLLAIACAANAKPLSVASSFGSHRLMDRIALVLKHAHHPPFPNSRHRTATVGSMLALTCALCVVRMGAAEPDEAPLASTALPDAGPILAGESGTFRPGIVAEKKEPRPSSARRRASSPARKPDRKDTIVARGRTEVRDQTKADQETTPRSGQLGSDRTASNSLVASTPPPNQDAASAKPPEAVSQVAEEFTTTTTSNGQAVTATQQGKADVAVQRGKPAPKSAVEAIVFKSKGS